MRNLAIFALFLVAVSSTNLASHLSDGDMTLYHKVVHSRWGRVVVELAELNALAEGPIDDLKNALRDLVNDATKQKEWTLKDHGSKENYHNKKVNQLNSNIQSAQNDIISLTSLLNNNLYPAKKNFEKNIRTLKSNIAHNLRVQAAETERSNAARKAFLLVQGEHKAAIADLDKCIRVVGGLINPSLAQVSQIHIMLRSVQASLSSHEKYAPMINSLLEIADMKTLKDANAIRGCVKLLNSLRQSIVDDLNAFTAIENARIAAYNKRMNQLRAELAMFRKLLAENIQGLTETIARIKSSIAQRAQRTKDLAVAQNDLKAEQADWVKECAIFEKNLTDIEEEIQGAGDVLAFLNNANFGSYLRSQVNAAGTKMSSVPRPKGKKL